MLSGTDASDVAKAATLIIGDKIKVEVTMSVPTTVTGTPQYAIDVGGETIQAVYASGSGTNKLVFTYTIASGDTDDAGGITAGTGALGLNGGTLKDVVGGNPALLATPDIGAGVNVVAVDAVTPVIPVATIALEADKTHANTAIFHEFDSHQSLARMRMWESPIV